MKPSDKEKSGDPRPPKASPSWPEPHPTDGLSEDGQAPLFSINETSREADFDFSNPHHESAPAPSARSSGSPRRRRGRANRLVTRLGLDEISGLLEGLARRSIPTVDFFVFSLLSGGILGVGYLLDAPAILLLGILIGPVLVPWAGAILAAATGEGRFFGQTSGSFFISALIIFGTGALAGLASRIWLPHTFIQAFLHSRLWVPDLLVLILGTLALVVGFIQSEEKPVVASVMVAYELYLPVSAAGFGLGSNVEGLWPQSLQVFFVHFAISMILALIVFYYMGFRPREASGYVFAGLIVALGLAVTVGFAGIGTFITVRADPPTPTLVAPTASVVFIPTPTDIPATSTPQPTFTATLLPTPEATATETPLPPTATEIVPTPTLLPTPVYGRVQTKGDGAVIRSEPGGPSMTTVQNGYLVEFLPDAPVVVNGELWVHVLIKTPARDLNGWVLLSSILTATPSVASP